MNKLRLPKQLDSFILNPKKFPVPAPFCINKKKVRAIILGCDPTNRSENHTTKILPTVFGIGTGDHRYFIDILNNLKQVGLNLENIYVQNVIPFYMNKVASENPHWNDIAEAVLPNLILELDSIDKGRRIPVFMTSEIIYKFLLINKKDYHKPRDFYNLIKYLPVKKDKNKLGRKLFPLYRHYHYSLSTNRFEDYKNMLRNALGT